jgi:hypothetical protein
MPLRASAIISGHMADIRELFAAPLAAKLGRTREELRDEGLGVGDFRIDEGVELTLPDGSTMSFRYAFVVLDVEQRLVGVFTEHCGYFCFGMADLSVRELRRGEVVREQAW